MHVELLLKVTINDGKQIKPPVIMAVYNTKFHVVKWLSTRITIQTSHGFESQYYKFFPGKPLAAIVIPPQIVYMAAIYYRRFSFLDTCFAGKI